MLPLLDDVGLPAPLVVEGVDALDDDGVLVTLDGVPLALVLPYVDPLAGPLESVVAPYELVEPEP